MSQNAPNIAFLGLCERAIYDTSTHPLLWKHDLIGLKETIVSCVYPFSLSGFHSVLALYDPESLKSSKIKVLDPDGKELFQMEVKIKYKNIEPPDDVGESKDTVDLYMHNTQYPVWKLALVPLSNKNIIFHPGEHKIVLHNKTTEVAIGCLTFVLPEVEPLTKARIAAIRSNPNAAKSIRTEIGCNQCNEKLSIYCGIEHSKELENLGYSWYKDIPDTFECKCKSIKADVTSYKNNFHAFLGTKILQEQRFSPARLYEEHTIEIICRRFKKLLDSNPEEEKVQKFIKDHPILLQLFSPEKIFYKSPILSKFKTDITIINNKKELLLIELEKPETRLMIKNGHMAANMQHPLDQVYDWLNECETHKLAVIDSLKLNRDEISSIRGIVILGRDRGYKDKLYTEAHLTKLKSKKFHETTFYTYDDILKSLTSLLGTLKDFGSVR